MTTPRVATYDRIGIDYNRHRAAEPSVVRELVRLLGLPPGSVIADIGAGTGNYSNALAQQGYKLHAIEPSDVMRGQAARNPDVQWHAGTAEAIPLPSDSVDGVICTLALHHFDSVAQAAAELRRVCPSGPMVFLTIDPRLGETFWFSDYFPEIYQSLFSTFPPIEDICSELTKHSGSTSEITRWLLPHNASDMTMHSGWNRPEIYLDKSYRQNMSGFALASRVEIESGLTALQEALTSGAWERDHGHLRKRQEIDVGFRFIKLVRKEA
ncbi:MAG: class I SAM-dependent methyltransferase [Thermodesulfobacteriota bacterium]